MCHIKYFIMYKYGAAIPGHTTEYVFWFMLHKIRMLSISPPTFFFKDASNYDRFDFHPIQWNKGPWPPAILHFRTCATLLHYQLQSIILKTPSNAVYTVIVGTQNHPLPGFFQRIKYLFLSALDFFQGPCVDFCPGCCDGPCPDCRTSAWTLQNVWCKT